MIGDAGEAPEGQRMTEVAHTAKRRLLGFSSESLQSFAIVTISSLCVAFALIIGVERDIPPIFFVVLVAAAISVGLVAAKSEYGLHLVFFSILLPLRIPVGDGSIAGTWLIIFLLFGMYLLKASVNRSPLSMGSLVPLFIPFTLFACLSLVNAQDKTHGASKVILWGLSIVLLVITTDVVSRSRENVKKIRNLIYYVSLALGVIGIALIISGIIFGVEPVVSFMFSKLYPLVRSEADFVSQAETMRRYQPLLNWTVMDGKLMRNISLFLSPIVTASFFGLLAPLAMGFYLNMKSESKWHSFILYFALLNILLTQTRGAWVGIVVSLLMVLAISREVKRKVIVIATISLVGVVGLLFAGEVFLSRALALSRQAYMSIDTRLVFMERGIRIAMENSVTGIGFANYETYVNAPFHEYPHNQFIEVWAETGLGGLVSYALILAVLLRRNYVAMRNSPTAFDRGLYTGVFGAIIFFIMHSLFEDMLGAPPVLLTFMIIIGIAEGNRILMARAQAERGRVG